MKGDGGNSLVVQWLGLCAFTDEGPGSVRGRGTKIPQEEWPKKKKERREMVGLPWWSSG